MVKIKHDFRKFHVIFKTRVDVLQEILEFPELLWNKGFGVLLTFWIMIEPLWWKIFLYIPWLIISIDLRVEKDNG